MDFYRYTHDKGLGLYPDAEVVAVMQVVYIAVKESILKIIVKTYIMRMLLEFYILLTLQYEVINCHMPINKEYLCILIILVYLIIIIRIYIYTYIVAIFCFI